MRPLFSADLLERLKDKMKNEVSNTRKHCDKCGRDYDHIIYEDGSELKFGCDCEMIQMGIDANKRNKELARRREISAMYRHSILNPELEQATFDNYEPKNPIQRKAKLIAERYAESFTKDNPQSLLLKGSFGTGKSHLSMAIVKEVKKKGFTAVFINVPQLMSVINDTYNRNSERSELDIIRIMQETDLLVLDDIGVHLSQNGMAKLFQIVEGRMGKHTIYTTNLSQQELTKDINLRRIYSRMSAAYPIEVEGDDHRSWKARASQ